MHAVLVVQVLAALAIVVGASGIRHALIGRTEFLPTVRGFTLGFGVLPEGQGFIVYCGTHMLVCFLGSHDVADNR